MESLNYAFEDRGFLFSDELPLDSFTRGRNHKKELSLNPFSDHHETNGGEAFTESGLAEMLQRSESDDDLRETTKRMVPKSSTESKEVKRARIANFSSKQALVCQVLGCNRDLSSSKDYHKRHKVCDEHSKTPKVIVNGIEQRFCQQCSRFHMLAEFDDDKRSCRKRLAGHNERRRKPHRECCWGPRLLDTPGGEISIGSHSLLSSHSRNALRNSKMGTENHHSGTMNGSGNFTLSELDDFGVDYEAEMDRNLHKRSLDCLSFCHISAERGETIDLQQLSTHLVRVEQQRSYDKVKHHSCNLCFTFNN